MCLKISLTVRFIAMILALLFLICGVLNNNIWMSSGSSVIAILVWIWEFFINKQQSKRFAAIVEEFNVKFGKKMKVEEWTISADDY